MDELLFLEPVLKPTIWGGRRLADEWGYDCPDGPIGECWAISAHPHGDCSIAGGMHAGRTLSELWDEHRELFGSLSGDRFPLLVKIIDAEDDLSVQVHPDDAYAATHEGGSLGKHECWYVLGTHPHGFIAIGQHARNRAEFESLAANGRWDELVNEVPIWEGDFFDIKPGTLHAILAGTQILEVQQSSDITYRVYDYERRQADGTLRETHLEKALDVIDYGARAPRTGEVTAADADGVSHLLESADFSVERWRVVDERVMPQPWPFLCASVIEGEGSASVGECAWPLHKGSHFIAPSGSGDLTLRGDLVLITCHVGNPVPLSAGIGL